MAFSGGNADIHGDVTLTAGARVVTSGAGSVTTFFDDVIAQRPGDFHRRECEHRVLRRAERRGAVHRHGHGLFHRRPAAGKFARVGAVWRRCGLRRRHHADARNRRARRPARNTTRSTVAGTLHADGALDVVLYDGFTPQLRRRFDLFDAGNVAGSFDAVNLPALAGGLAWDATHLQSTGQLRVVPEPVRRNARAARHGAARPAAPARPRRDARRSKGATPHA